MLNFLQCTHACRATKADARRRHLIDTARALFTERGFHATGVAQIAAASGVKVGQIYRDFQGKEDIVAAIVEEDLANFLDEDALAAAVAAGDMAAVRAWVAKFVDAKEPLEECRMMTEIVAEAARNQRIAAIHRATNVRVSACLTDALEALIPGECCGNRLSELVDLILTLGLGLIYQRIANPEMNSPALVERMRRIIDGEIAALSTRPRVEVEA